MTAMAYLACIFFNLAKSDPKSSESRLLLQRGFGLLKEGRVLNPTQPLILLQLSETLFHRGELSKSYKLAEQALQSANGTETIAQAHFYLGRIFHIQVCSLQPCF